jgi:solute:Na+ symporter, SSS family
MTLEYLTLAVYFVFLIILGSIFARFNKNLSDFSRGGARLTWWMVGPSITMAGISAFTFTGNGSAAFEAGPSLLIIYVANLLGFFVGGVVLARWYRQSRAYTGPDVVKGRFGGAAEQFQVYAGLLTGPFSAAVQLWALAIFVSTVFGFPLGLTILAVGGITIFYSASGGSWAVIATDFVQAIVLYGITLLAGFLAWQAVGGFSGFFAQIEAQELERTFSFIKEAGEYPSNRYTWGWAAVIFMMQLIGQVQLTSATRYLSAKDGREASRAAWLAFGLMAVGSAVWFFPPMVARLLFAEEVMAMPIQDPATAAYAVAAQNLLPNGLMGVLIAAMFAATMSSMDSGLAGQTSIIVRNIIPRVRERLGMAEMPDQLQLRLCRWISLTIGVLIILSALLLAKQTRFVLFDAFLTLSSVIGAPLGLPLLAGLLLRRLHSWSYFLIFFASVIPSAYSLIVEATGGTPWTVQERGGWVLIWGGTATLFSWLIRQRASAKHQAREAAFFQQLFTPVDFEAEIGGARDHEQARLLGRSATAMGTLLLGFLWVPNDSAARWQIAALALTVLGLGILLWWYGRKRPEVSKPSGKDSAPNVKSIAQQS